MTLAAYSIPLHPALDFHFPADFLSGVHSQYAGTGVERSPAALGRRYDSATCPANACCGRTRLGRYCSCFAPVLRLHEHTVWNASCLSHDFSALPFCCYVLFQTTHRSLTTSAAFNAPSSPPFFMLPPGYSSQLQIPCAAEGGTHYSGNRLRGLKRPISRHREPR